MSRRLAVLSLWLLTLDLGISQAAPPEPVQDQGETIAAHPLPLRTALHVARAALDACRRHGHSVSVFVLDAHGNLRVVLTGDNAKVSGLSTAPLKAAAVLAFGVSSRELASRMASDEAFARQYKDDARYNFHDGAVPIYRRHQLLGVLALGGAHGIDDLCANEALRAAPELTSVP